MAETNKDYENIEIPYNQFLERSEQEENNGSVQEAVAKDGGAISDIWITNFIKSENWQPKKRGFYIDGQTGYAEFSNVFISADITASTINIGDGFHVDIGGNVWWGSSTTYADSTIKISSEGIANLTGATISGNVTITGGTGLANLSDAGDLALKDKIGAIDCNSTIISGGKIITGLLTASNIQTGTLSAIDIEGVTITGSLLRTAVSGERIEINKDDENAIRFFNLGGYDCGYIGPYGSSSSIYGISINGTGNSGWGFVSGGNSSRVVFQTVDSSGNKISEISIEDENIGLDGTVYVNGNLNTVGNLSTLVFINLGNLTDSLANVLPYQNGSMYYSTTTSTVKARCAGSWVSLGAGTSGANTSLSNLTTTSINQSLRPSSDGSYNLGASSRQWDTVYCYQVSADGNIGENGFLDYLDSSFETHYMMFVGGIYIGNI